MASPLARLLRLRCPHCGKGSLKAGLFKTPRECPSCARLFEKEPGFFTGAIYIAYFMGFVVGAPPFLFATIALSWPAPWSMALAAACIVLLSPWIFWYSRALFINADLRFFQGE